MKPVVAIIGRPNVGKSTLFNRLTRSNRAIVDDIPGVTRDRHYGDVTWDDRTFTLVDTGGFMADDDDIFMGQIHFQIRQAVQEANAILVILDGKHGLSPFDREILTFLQETARPQESFCPVFYLVNKIDGEERQPDMYDFHCLGLDTLYPVSAAHGYGLRDFLDSLVAALPPAETNEDGMEAIKVAVVGKPNSGKSTLINRIIGQERLIVSETPGTTRDSLDTRFARDGRAYLLIDTAGLRRKSRAAEKIERFSALKTLHSLERCDLALILIDALEGVTQQDITIAGYAYERGCGCIFLINKWDLARQQARKAKTFYDDLRYQAKFLNFAPAMAISAATGWRVKKIFTLVDEVYGQYSATLRTGEINRIFETATRNNEPPLHQGKRLRFNYATQVASCPPTFVCFVNFPGAVHFSYQRYLLNTIRREAGLDKTPLRLFFREKTGRTEFSRKKHKQRQHQKSGKR